MPKVLPPQSTVSLVNTAPATQALLPPLEEELLELEELELELEELEELEDELLDEEELLDELDEELELEDELLDEELELLELEVTVGSYEHQVALLGAPGKFANEQVKLPVLTTLGANTPALPRVV